MPEGPRGNNRRSAGRRPRLVVFAGVNGAGKSSILGSALRQAGGSYHNPDELAARLLQDGEAESRDQAAALAWAAGRRGLERAIAEHLDFAFETTLGGTTITSLLIKAAQAGFELWVIYIGLESASLHWRRVRARVARGGHDIPVERINARFESSRVNLVRLLPHVTELRLLDNSRGGDPAAGRVPEPTEIMRISGGRVSVLVPLDEVPGWARPVVAAAAR